MNVPKIRFPEFRDDYVVVKFGDVVSYQKGFAFKSKDYTNEGIRIIRITDTTKDSIKENDGIYINENNAKQYTNYILKENDIIISSVGSRPPLYDSMVGKVILVPKHANNTLLNQNAIRFRSDLHNQIYIYNYLKQNSYTKYIESIMRGNANQRSITLEDLFEFNMNIPFNINEENKVSVFLSLLDKKIELQSKKIEDLKLFKKGLNYKLFSDCKEEYSLNDILEEYNKKTQGNNEYAVLSSTASGIYLQSDYFNKQAASQDTTGYKILPRGYVTYRSMSDTGEFHFNEQNIIDYGIVSPAYPVFKINEKKVNKIYLLHYMNENKSFINNILSTKEGGTRFALSYSKLLSIRIKLPSIDKQNQYSLLICSVNKKIENENKKLCKLNELKKGLMQKMFV